MDGCAPDAPKGSASRQQTTQDDHALHESRLQQWMGDQVEHPWEKQTGRASAKARVPNQHMLQAWDHALRAGCGLSLSHFMPARRATALGLGERRFHVPVGSGPQTVPFAEGDPTLRRCCVEHVATKRGRFELPRVPQAGAAALHRPSLHVAIDQGSIGWPGWLYTFTGLGVRGTLWMDPWHRITNNLDQAVKASNLYLVQLETSIVWDVGSGPWDKAAFHGNMSGAAKKFLQVAKPSDELLSLLFHGLCVDELDFPSDFGSEAHQARVLERLQRNFVLRGKGDKVKLGRWFAWWDAASDKMHQLHQLLLFLTYYAILARYWPSLADSPLVAQDHGGPGGGSASSGSAAGEGCADAPGADANSLPQRSTVKESNKELDELRKKSKNQLELCIRILCGRRTRRLAWLLLLVPEPLRIQTGKWITMCKTAEGTCETYTCWASGGYLASLGECLACLSSPLVMKRLGFNVLADPVHEDTDKADNKVVADTMLAYVGNFLGMQLVGFMYYSHSPPGLFALLLSHSEAARGACLERLERIWRWLEKAEKESHTNSRVAAVLADLVWTRWAFVREIFLALDEAAFKGVPDDACDALRCLFKGVLTTKVCEDSFRFLRRQAANNERGHIGRRRRWAALLTSRLLAEADMKPAPVSEAARQAKPAQLAKSIFEADVEDFSLGMDSLHNISSDEFSSRSPLNFALMPLCLQCCLDCGDEWDLLGLAFQSLLVTPGSVIVQRSRPKSVFWAAHVSEWGLLCWRLDRKKVGDTEHFHPAQYDPDQPLPYEFIRVTGLKETRGLEGEATWPQPHNAVTSDGAIQGIAMRKKGVAIDLCVHAAQTGFARLTVPRCQALLKVLHGGRHKGSVPRRERDVVTALLVHAEPKITPEEIERRLQIRNRKLSQAEQPSTVLMSPEAMELASAVIDEDEFEAKFVAPVRKACEQVSAESSAKATSSSSSSGLSGPPTALPRKRAPVRPEGGHLSEQEAKEFLPPGCRVHQETKWHIRWRLVMPHKDAPPYSNTKSFQYDDPASQHSALLSVLNWGWKHHTAMTGQVCPWDLSGA